MTTAFEFVYIGARLHQGELVYAYVQVRDGAISERAFMYPKPLGDDQEVGTHCTYNGTSVHNVTPVPIKWFGQWKDHPMVNAWRAMHETNIASHLAWVENPPRGMEDIVAPLREAYQALDERDRPVLLAQVIHAIVETRD